MLPNDATDLMHDNVQIASEEMHGQLRLERGGRAAFSPGHDANSHERIHDFSASAPLLGEAPAVILIQASLE